MPNPIVLGTPATCGDLATATSTVKVGGLAVSKVDIDSAGGSIVGPGSLQFRVFVEGVPMSLIGDSIASHPDHPSQTFASPLPNVVSVRIGP